jgi:predicted AlkP superfamily pyrophosphatase or phosphodiesterase
MRKFENLGNWKWIFKFSNFQFSKLHSIFFFPFFVFSNFLSAQDSSQHIIPGRFNSSEQIKKPYVILISADGFRYDLADKYRAKNLIRLRESGVEANYMLSVFPSLTFPNHYSIATGDYPSHHGIVDNSFYDPIRHKAYTMGKRSIVEDSSWYGATPIWVLAEKQSMLSASFYWVGTDAAIQGIRPTYYYKYNTQIPMDERIRIVLNWLSLPENIRPHLITFYMPDVDHEEHLYGTNSKQTAMAVYYTDKAVGDLVRSIDSLHLPVNFIFLSDHGMIDIDTLHTIPLPDGIDTNRFVILNSLSIAHLYAKDSADILPAYHLLKQNAKDYDVYLAKELPSRWHYHLSDDYYHRIGDIILVSRAPKVFNFTGHHVNRATHGFEPKMTEMHATFYAWGPAFKSGFKIDGFENIHVFPLITKILSLQNPISIDGRLDILEKVLRAR